MSENGQTNIEFETSSGNVFADLGLENADELLAHADLGIQVYKLVRGRNLQRREIGTLLGIELEAVAHLLNGDFDEFTTDQLLEFLKRFDQKATITVNPRKPGGPAREARAGRR